MTKEKKSAGRLAGGTGLPSTTGQRKVELEIKTEGRVLGLKNQCSEGKGETQKGPGLRVVRSGRPCRRWTHPLRGLLFEGGRP